MKRYISTSGFMALMLLGSINYVCAAVSWDDVFYSTGQYKGGQKVPWDTMTEEQKVFYLERYKKEIDYCLSSFGKKAKDLDPEMQCCAGTGDAPVSYQRIGLKYSSYGDHKKSAYYCHKDWGESLKNPNWRMFDDPLYSTITGYEVAGMYKEALPFYQIAYTKLVERLKAGTNTSLLKTNFKEYQKNWPEEADEYLSLKRSWDKAKKLAKTEKPKPLDPAVQHHEWFYSDKQEEVLKALEYYNINKVPFMLEKALKHKDPVVAAKAKECLGSLSKSEPNSSGRGR